MSPDALDLMAADLEWLLTANPDNNPEVAFWIGYCHYWGTGGVQQNNKTAVLYFQKAANHNHAKALRRLAWCNDNGLGVSEDKTRATQLFQQAKAALQSNLQNDHNDAEAQLLLGLSYNCGYGGLNEDAAIAFSLYQQAAQQGHVVGQWNVGYCLEYGLGVAQDCVQAVGWYGQAARQGHSKARTKFHNLLKEKAELKEQLAAVARGALDQQATFLAASALAYHWRRKNGANSTAAQQWQAIADKGTNKVPPSWKPRILKPLSQLQTIQSCKDVPDRQAQLVAFAKQLAAYCNSSSADNPEMFRVFAYCYDHGFGVDEDQEQALRLYVKADKLMGIKPAAVKKKGCFGFRKTNLATKATTASSATRCCSAEWLYKRLKDERVTCYQTRFELDEALAILRTKVTRGKTAFESATIEHAIRCKFELEFLQGLLRMEEFTSEAELRKKADKLSKQAAEDITERLPLIKELEQVTEQLQKEARAREGAELQRRLGAASASQHPPSAPFEEDHSSNADNPESCQIDTTQSRALC